MMLFHFLRQNSPRFKSQLPKILPRKPSPDLLTNYAGLLIVENLKAHGIGNEMCPSAVVPFNILNGTN